MPLPLLAGKAEAEGMEITALGVPALIAHYGPRQRGLARLLGASLDRQLAAGRPPESSPLLAARARLIVSLSRRTAMAANWRHLLTVAARQAAGPRGAPPGAAPLRADRIIAAAPAIGELARRLAAPLPVPARGVAMATVLLTDAGSPVYSRRSAVPLGAAVEAAIAQLDPALPLLPVS
jgi:hypothetical protein